MTRDEAIKIVEDTILDQLFMPSTDYSLEEKLSDLGDSLDLVEMTLIIEEKCKCEFPKDLSQFKVVRDVIDFVEKHEIQNS
jgi:acyl carrier protein